MDYDLYGSVSAPTPTPAPSIKMKPTTIEAMAAAEWTGPDVQGRWTLMWDDHTDYGHEPGGGTFVCNLYEVEGRWTYEVYHSDRAGGVEEASLGLDVEDFDIDAVQVACKVGALTFQLERWEQGMEEYVSRQPGRDDS